MLHVSTLVCLLFISSFCLFAQQTEYEVKSAQLKQIASFITWPFEKDSTNPKSFFVVGILGQSTYNHYNSNITAIKTIKELPVQVLQFSSEHDITDCDLLLVGKCSAETIINALKKVKDKPVLTICDVDDNMKYGLMMGFYIKSGKVRFYANTKQTQKSKLKFSSNLIRLAKQVESDYDH